MKKFLSCLPVLFVFISATAFAAKAPRISALSVLESYTVPTIEISGMAWRKNPKTQSRELVIVNDRNHKIFLVDWQKRKTAFQAKEVDLKKLVGAAAEGQSEWESVFSDETGRIFIIKENPAQILVISADLTQVETKIDLSVPRESKESIGWDKDMNSRGEGLIPLKNGHILVVKEKNPLRIIEFAPVKHKSEGYRPELSIEATGSFPLSATNAVTFSPVSTWKFNAETENLFEDSSGLNADPKGALYLLGDQRSLIGKIGDKLKTNQEQLKIKQLWTIPSALKNPEGMVIDDDTHPIIAIDRKKTDEPNLFLLSPLK